MAEGMSGAMGYIIRKAEEANPPETGDYIDEEGFLCCGKCHTRRQVEIDKALATINSAKVEQAWKAGEYVLSAEDFAGVSFNTGS